MIQTTHALLLWNSRFHSEFDGKMNSGNISTEAEELTQELQNATETTINPVKYEGHIRAVEFLKTNGRHDEILQDKVD